MNLIKSKWKNKDYQEFICYLKSLNDEKYLNFHKNLLNDDIKLIGIRTPILKNIAKGISKGNYQEFINQNKHEYYEEIIIHGLIIGYLNLDFDDTTGLLTEFLIYNTNWAINDIVGANLKIFKKNQSEGYNYIIKLLDSNKPFDKRFGIVLLLDFYINDYYIDNILEIVLNIDSGDYYVNMAIAWLISICYIKYPTKTILLLESNRLNDWIHNKSIQKIIESKRIKNKEKEILRKLKRNKNEKNIV